MKKMFIFALVFQAILSVYLFADMPITADALPKNALSFIQTNFNNATIAYAERDRNEFDVSLSDGTKISFMLNGEWKDVSGYVAIPTGFIPANVVATVKKTYSTASIMEIEKKHMNFKIKLDNMMELYINQAGALVGQKFDD